MKAFSWEYRWRFALHAAVYALGFWAPWCAALGWARGSLWLWAAVALDRAGVGTLSSATVGLLLFGFVCATAGAWLRTWGAAYLGSDVVADGGMHGADAGESRVIADGPFRWMRNPLYMGTLLHTLALALLMPASGAVFCVAAIAAMQVRLLLAEEAFLGEKLGAPYAAYRAAVPRTLPSLSARVTQGGMTPRWGQAFLGEVYFWGVAVSFAVLGWRYNANLLMQCVVVSLGVGLVARGVAGKQGNDGPIAS